MCGPGAPWTPPPRGLSHATPLVGCCVTVHDPSPAHAGGSCHPCQGVVTTRPAYPAQSRGRRARPCRRVVLSGNTRPGRKPRRAHTHGVDRGKTPRAADTSCVTGRLLARVEGLEATLTPRPLIPYVPLRPSENPPSDTLKGTLQNPPLRAHGASLSGGLSSFGHRLE